MCVEDNACVCIKICVKYISFEVHILGCWNPYSYVKEVLMHFIFE